jgi:bacillopeptidase F
MGTARVYIDGIYKGTVNNYSALTHWRVPRTFGHLSSALHTLRIVVTGLHSPASKGTQIVVDAMKVGTTLAANPALSTRWDRVSAAYASGGAFALADLAGGRATMTFRGTSIGWQSLMSPYMGRARVYIDGVLKGTFDNYAAHLGAISRAWHVSDGVHTISILVLGTHRTGALGSRVVVDRLYVG